MHDHEPGHVGDGALEAGVLAATNDHGVHVVHVHRFAYDAIAALDLRRTHHDCSNPFTSAQIARFSGVGTRCSSPNRTMPPLR